ncbi:hypothetical protein ACQKIO_19755, partial [Pseudomonas sp. NPDC047959]
MLAILGLRASSHDGSLIATKVAPTKAARSDSERDRLPAPVGANLLAILGLRASSHDGSLIA